MNHISREPCKQRNVFRTRIRQWSKETPLLQNFLVYVDRGTPLGKSNRVVLSRCVVTKIRGRYPDQNGNTLDLKIRSKIFDMLLNLLNIFFIL